MEATKQNMGTTIRTAANIYWDRVEANQGPIYVVQIGGLKICAKISGTAHYLPNEIEAHSHTAHYEVKIMSRGRVLRELVRDMRLDLPNITDADILTIAGQHAFTAMCELLSPFEHSAPPCVYSGDKVCVGA